MGSADRRQLSAPELPAPLDLPIAASWERWRSELAAVVAEVLEGQDAPALLTDERLAMALDVGRQQVAKLAADGAPHVFVGDRRRWQLAKVIAWLETRQQGGAT